MERREGLGWARRRVGGHFGSIFDNIFKDWGAKAGE